MLDKDLDNALKGLSNEALKMGGIVAGINAVLLFCTAVIASVFGLLILGLAPEGMTKFIACVACWVIAGYLSIKADQTSDAHIEILKKVE